MSPDGLIWNEERRGHGIIEIKCLFSYKDKKIENTSHLDENGQLKNTDKWYTQVCVKLNFSPSGTLFIYLTVEKIPAFIQVFFYRLLARLHWWSFEMLRQIFSQTFWLFQPPSK